MSRYCVLKGTKISLINGSIKNIEELKIGDQIIVFNIDNIVNTQDELILQNIKLNNFNGLFKTSRVKNIWTNQRNHYFIINDKLKITGDHFILVQRDNTYYWTKVDKLQLNDLLFTEQNIFECIVSIEEINEDVKVYNIQVDTYYNYFANQYLIHNGAPCAACTACGDQFTYYTPIQTSFGTPITIGSTPNGNMAGSGQYGTSGANIASRELFGFAFRPTRVLRLQGVGGLIRSTTGSATNIPIHFWRQDATSASHTTFRGHSTFGSNGSGSGLLSTTSTSGEWVYHTLSSELDLDPKYRYHIRFGWNSGASYNHEHVGHLLTMDSDYTSQNVGGVYSSTGYTNDNFHIRLGAQMWSGTSMRSGGYPDHNHYDTNGSILTASTWLPLPDIRYYIPIDVKLQIHDLDGISDFSSHVATFIPEDYSSLNKEWFSRSNTGNQHAIKYINNNSYQNSAFHGSPTLESTNGITGKDKNNSTHVYSVFKGGTSDGCEFPEDVYSDDSTYTLFHVSRWTSTSTTYAHRIFDGDNNNWFSGYWRAKRGLAYHESWITQSTATVADTGSGTNNSTNIDGWNIMCDQHSLLRFQGVTQSTAAGVSDGPNRITINAGTYGNGGAASERSKYEIAEVIFFNEQLPLRTCQKIEEYLSYKYQIGLSNGSPHSSIPKLKGQVTSFEIVDANSWNYNQFGATNVDCINVTQVGANGLGVFNDPNSTNYDPRTLFGGTGTGLKVNYTMNSSYSSAAHSHTENGDCYFDNETCSITFYYKRINTVTISASGSGYRVGEMIYIEPPAANYVNIPCPNCGNNSGNYGYNQSNSWVTYGPLGYYYNKTNSSCGDTNTNCWIGGFIAAFPGGGYVGATHQTKIYYVLRVTSVS